MATPKKPQNLALAKALLEAGVEDGTPFYVVKAPVAGTDHARDVREKDLFGVTLREGVGVTTDAHAVDLIRAEFPTYSITEG